MKKFLSLFILIYIFHLPSKADEGMWIPMLLGELNEAEMQAMGMRITADDIYNINHSSLKDAIAIFGRGCTAEIVSEDGLILTNHHCGYGIIQKHSSLEHDYLTDGFWAMDRSEELPNPGLTVTFMVRMKEVTDQVLEGIEDNMTEVERREIISVNIDSIEVKAVKDTHYKAKVKPFFQGNQYFLFINEVFEDVRLVGAPPSNIGKFGGDTDNWMWPRHTGDFSVFRIYADTNNQPAKYSEDNVPYKPKEHLAISIKGVEEGDFTFIFGYPGSTEQYIPSYAVEMITNVVNPVRIKMRDKRLQIFKKAMNQSPEVRIQYAVKQSRIANGWKKWIGENRGIKRLNSIEKKQEMEAEFVKWANSSDELQKKYGQLLNEFENVYKELAPLNYNIAYLFEAGFGVEIIRYARSFDRLVQLSEDKETEQEEIDELVEKLKNSAESHFKNYQLFIDKEVFTAMMSSYYNNMDKNDMPEIIISMYDKYKGDFEKMADEIFDKSIFGSEEKIKNFLEHYKRSKYKKIVKDPVCKIAQGLSEYYYGSLMPGINSLRNKTDSLMRIYMRGQMEMQPKRKFYPDANFTLRVAYGNIESYKPGDAVSYNYFTTLKGIMQKEDPDIYDYVVEDELKELYNNKDYGKYADKDGSMHVCFIANNHTSGGNSGSPVLDADGNLIGINFDRCWEGTMSDIVFDRSQCRNITLDIRYCLFIIDKFAGATHLIEEMTIVD